ncbi:MAG TPA: ribosome-associated translation inhibitor RaiA [Bacteroidota bacterium]|nr:ribosome-associated translation inhibitor RaiA [Bacteroidota bacterium]
MQIKITARRFRAREELRQHTLDAVGKLDHFYDGIVSAAVIFSYERAANSVKSAEINLHVYGGVLTARESTDDYIKSVDAAVEKLTMQLRKYKSKLRLKDKTKVRAIKEEQE